MPTEYFPENIDAIIYLIMIIVIVMVVIFFAEKILGTIGKDGSIYQKPKVIEADENHLKLYARELARLLDNSDPLAIAITGDQKCGKTTLMHWLRRYLKNLYRYNETWICAHEFNKNEAATQIKRKILKNLSIKVFCNLSVVLICVLVIGLSISIFGIYQINSIDSNIIFSFVFLNLSLIYLSSPLARYSLRLTDQKRWYYQLFYFIGTVFALLFFSCFINFLVTTQNILGYIDMNSSSVVFKSSSLAKLCHDYQNKSGNTESMTDRFSHVECEKIKTNLLAYNISKYDDCDINCFYGKLSNILDRELTQEEMVDVEKVIEHKSNRSVSRFNNTIWFSDINQIFLFFLIFIFSAIPKSTSIIISVYQRSLRRFPEPVTSYILDTEFEERISAFSKPIVVFVDDIDQCNQEIAYEVVNAIFLLQNTISELHAHCHFVLAFVPEIIIHKINPNKNQDGQDVKDEVLSNHHIIGRLVKFEMPVPCYRKHDKRPQHGSLNYVKSTTWTLIKVIFNFTYKSAEIDLNPNNYDFLIASNMVSRYKYKVLEDALVIWEEVIHDLFPHWPDRNIFKNQLLCHVIHTSYSPEKYMRVSDIVALAILLKSVHEIHITKSGYCEAIKAHIEKLDPKDSNNFNLKKSYATHVKTYAKLTQAPEGEGQQRYWQVSDTDRKTFDSLSKAMRIHFANAPSKSSSIILVDTYLSNKRPDPST